MRVLWMAVLTAALLVAGACASEAPDLKDPRNKASYAIGVDMGKTLKRNMVDIDPDVLATGFRHAYEGKETLLSSDEIEKTLLAFEKELREKQMAHLAKKSEGNKTEGEVFLEANKKKDGVVALPSGLQYKVLASGKGASPKASDTVEVNYRGTLIDGTEFDSSYKRGKAAVFGVGRVIPGWTEALQLMKVGDKWQLFIPPNLAYGERGAPGGVIGPNATLVFEVELVGIK